MEGIEMEGFDPVVEQGTDFGALILSKLGNSQDSDHQHLCIVVGTMAQELRDNTLALSPTAYFCSTISSLDKLSSVAPNTRDPAVDSLFTLLSMVIPRVSAGVLKKKKQFLLELLERVLRSKDMSPVATAAGLVCIARVLMVKDDAAWSGVAHMYALLLNYVADSQSKVRRQCHLCLRDVLQSFQGTSLLLGPASEGIKSMLERLILLAGGSQTAASEGPKGAQEVLYVLDMLKECLPYMSTKYKSSILKFYKTLLELQQPVVSRRVNDSLNALCLHPTSEINPDILLELLCFLAMSLSTNETSADTMTFTARLLDAGMRKIYAMNRNICIAKLPVIFNALKVILEFDYAEAQVAAVEAMKSLIAVCIDDKLIEEGILDIQISRPTVIGKVCATIGSLLDYRCSGAWDMSFQVVSALFEKLGVYSFELLGRTLKDLGEMQKLSDDDFPYRKQLHDCVGFALGAMGPEKFLSIIPLNFEEEDVSQANVWLIPILKQHTVGGSLRFYAEQLLDMAEHLKKRSSQLKSEGRVVSARNADALVYSLWSLLPSFCNYPLDTAESFGDDLKTPLKSALAEEPDTRGMICSALQILIHQNKNILTNNMILDGEDIPTRRAVAHYTQTMASENMAVLKSSARVMLSVLTDVFLKSTKDSGGCLLATISEFASISEGKVVLNRFIAIMNGFKGSEGDEPRAQYLDVAMSLIPGLPEDAIDILFMAIDPVLKGDQGLVQKKGYKVLSIMLKNCDSFIASKLDELLKLMIELIPSCHSSSKRHRLDCLYYLIVHIFKQSASEEGRQDMVSSFLTEILLSLKEANKKTRNRAFDILVQIGHAYGDEEQGGTKENLLQFFGMVAGGLAGETPHMISAAVKGLARLAYEFSDLISSTYNLLPSTLLLLHRKNREISKASLGLMKVLVAKSQADLLQSQLKSLVEGVLRWPNDTKNHFRAKVKNLLEMLVKKCGLDAVKAVMPEEHRRLLTNIRRVNARKERRNSSNTETGSFASKTTTSRLSKWNHSKIFSDGESDDDMDLETVSGGKSLASSRLKSKVSSLRSKRTGKSGKSLPDDLLDQLENEPLDLLDKQKTRAMLRSGGSLKRKIDDSDEIELDSEGRLIIREEATKTKRKTEQDDDDNSDFDDNKSEAANSTLPSKKDNKRRKKESESSGYAYTGKEYESKRAEGDLKRKGKFEPYAYWPLDRKMVSRRAEHRASARRGITSVVKMDKKRPDSSSQLGTSTKSLEGKSSKTALSMLNKVKKKNHFKK